MGTPTEATWPGVSKLPDYNVGFPSWTKMRLSEVVKGLPPDGIDLLEVGVDADIADLAHSTRRSRLSRNS